MRQMINDQKFTNIQKAQAGLTRLFEEAKKEGSFYTVLRNDDPLGVLVPQDIWRSLIEDLEALSSEGYLKKVAKARKDKKTYTLGEVKKQAGL